MPLYDVEFTYDLPEEGSVRLQANNPELAKELAVGEIEEIYGDDIKNMNITNVEEVTTDAESDATPRLW